jgi:hypothetical protein
MMLELATVLLLLLLTLGILADHAQLPPSSSGGWLAWIESARP